MFPLALKWHVRAINDSKSKTLVGAWSRDARCNHEQTNVVVTNNVFNLIVRQDSRLATRGGQFDESRAYVHKSPFVRRDMHLGYGTHLLFST